MIQAEQQKQADLMKVSDLMFSLSLGPNDKPDVKEKLFAEITEKSTRRWCDLMACQANAVVAQKWLLC